MTSHAEFSQTRNNGVAKSGAYLVLSTLAEPALQDHKAGIIITRKIRNAVTRNRLRRRIHAILARHLNSIDSSQGKRYIVTVLRWRAPQATSEQLEQDWLKQARRLGIIKPTAA
jgi:ribonuclease P protein component